jgi:L-methionine (R)-S-oxide reductase
VFHFNRQISTHIETETLTSTINRSIVAQGDSDRIASRSEYGSEHMSDQVWLEQYLRDTGSIAGTLHRAEPGGLRLTAALNIPPPVKEIVAWVPEGKGMAGQAMVTREAVSTCNLKDDPSATVRPGARAVDAQAAIAIPLYDDDGPVFAVVGLAYSDGRDFPPAEIDRLTRMATAALVRTQAAQA